MKNAIARYVADVKADLQTFVLATTRPVSQPKVAGVAWCGCNRCHVLQHWHCLCRNNTSFFQTRFGALRPAERYAGYGPDTGHLCTRPLYSGNYDCTNLWIEGDSNDVQRT